MNTPSPLWLRPTSLLLCFSASFLFIGCSGGSGPVTPVAKQKAPGSGGKGGSSKTRKDLNQGTYNIKSFAYSDPNPKTFHPLDTATFRALERKELAVLGGETGKWAAWYGMVTGEAQEKFALDPAVPKKALESGVLRAAASGDWDGAVGDELVAVSSYQYKQLRLTVRGGGNAKPWTTAFLATINGVNANVAAVRLADVDLDGRNEIVVSYSGWMVGSPHEFLVFDDALSKGKLIYREKSRTAYLGEQVGIWVEDFDGDGKVEILEGRWDPSSFAIDVQVRNLSDKGYSPRVTWRSIANRYRRQTIGMVVGNFDEDRAMEFAMVSGTNTYWTTAFFGLDSASRIQGISETRATLGPGFQGGQIQWKATSYGMVAADLDGNQRDEVVFGLSMKAGLGLTAQTLGHGVPKDDASAWSKLSSIEGTWISRLTNKVSYSALAAMDDDGDGVDELRLLVHNMPYLSLLRLEINNSKKQKGKKVIGPAPSNYLSTFKSLTGSARIGILVPGDYDGQDLLLKSTGRKWASLPDPMPIVILAAAPTKTGITQNYDGSYTSYEEEKSVERSYGVSTGWTASLSRGFTADDITGTFGASVKATMTWALSKTLTKSKRVTYSSSFTGTYDQDVIVFQGTLYTCYEYEILRAPDARLIGTKMTINDPVATQIYKWTLPFYNRSVSASAQIGRDVISHSIGKPESYWRRARAESLIKNEGGWIHIDGITTGQGQGNNSIGIKVSQSNSTSLTRSFSVGVEAEVKVAGNTMGGGFSIDKSSVYTVTTEQGTAFDGRVGDISDTEDWNNWHYRFGIFVRRHGVDKKGRAKKGSLPVQIVDYWVLPQGAMYQ